jgi:hypothetical protein
MSAALAKNTRSTYHSGQRSFLDFCQLKGIDKPMPARTLDVCMWLASLAARRLRYTTIDNYRWALHSLHTEWGLPSIINTDPQIMRIIDGIKRSQGALALRPPRLPITPTAIRAMAQLLDPLNGDHRMLLAAMWVACVGLLRPGELGVEDPKKPLRMLTVASLSTISTNPPVCSIQIAESKT